ncbi:anti-sigma factor family protein [Marinobacter sp. DUT-1]|uniref:anti-sigma factor family protein n=1 Tax=Marinobacter sp. DUT-1 TaxID=3412037 RepID=UPI003D173CF5
MSCPEIRVSLVAYLNNELPAQHRDQVAEHLSVCAACSRALEAERLLGEKLQVRQRIPEPSGGFEARVLSAATTEPARQGRWSHRVFGGAIAAALALGVSLGVILNKGTSPDPQQMAGQKAPEPVVFEPVEQTVKLAFRSGQALDNVTLTLELPPNVELSPWPGRQQLSWQISLDAGENVVSLPLRVLFPGSGELVARLHTGEQQKSFRVEIPGAIGNQEVPAS